ncbi:hypothetical protein V5799_027547 [Amblyomma americanum]|uniref:Uncharacterized protein n=1 Tax=Amblyomma americanum TaxID=6943 RepID=A0AAQ4DFE7_AMBAM
MSSLHKTTRQVRRVGKWGGVGLFSSRALSSFRLGSYQPCEYRASILRITIISYIKIGRRNTEHPHDGHFASCVSLKRVQYLLRCQP